MLDSLPECKLPRPIMTQNVGFAEGIAHLDTLPLVVGVGAAAVTIILTPIVAPAVLSTLGFGAIGPVAGKSSPKYPLFNPGYIKVDLFRIN